MIVSLVAERESSRGKKVGVWALKDTCASPDVGATEAWHVSAGRGKGWRPSPGLACVEASEEELPPPHALRLGGGHDGGEAVARHLGRFKLQPRRVNGRPAWRSVERPREYLAWAGHGSIRRSKVARVGCPAPSPP